MENNQNNKIKRIKLQVFDDSPDGSLFIGEGMKNIPFAIKRFYFINNLTNPDAVRGNHAHKELDQVIFCVNGSFELGLDDGYRKWNVLMDNPSIGIYLRKKIWHSMTKFSPDCVILVTANDHYNEDDYIRDYEDFLRYVRKSQHANHPIHRFYARI